MAFPTYPYTDFHRLNGDYLLEQVNKAAADAATAQANAEAAIGRAEEAGEAALTAVRYEAQDLTAEQKAQARANIEAVSEAQLPDVSDVVRTSPQTLTPAQQAQARSNIGAISEAQLPDVSDVVRTSAQTLTTAQQMQARGNIGAAQASELHTLAQTVSQMQSSLTNKVDINDGKAVNLKIVSSAGVGQGYGAVLLGSGPSGTGRLDIVQVVSGEEVLGARARVGVGTPISNDDAATKAYVDGRGLPPATEANAGMVPTVQSDGTYALAALGEGIHTIQDLLDLTEIMSEEQRARFAANTDLERHPATRISATSAGSLYPVNNTIYRYGTLTSLQIQAAPAGIQYIIKFISGSTPTVFTPPTDEILGLSDFVPEANTEYEINVWDNRAVIGSWAVSST